MTGQKLLSISCPTLLWPGSLMKVVKNDMKRVQQNGGYQEGLPTDSDGSHFHHLKVSKGRQVSDTGASTRSQFNTNRDLQQCTSFHVNLNLKFQCQYTNWSIHTQE